jgi:hypothetical protein
MLVGRGRKLWLGALKWKSVRDGAVRTVFDFRVPEHDRITCCVFCNKEAGYSEAQAKSR